MKIRSIEIISFGKFKDKTISFNDGLNTIYGNNESGKSTVIDFIYAMLFGFGDKRGKELSLREKYTPWSGGDCEGKLNLFTDDGEAVTIYRKAGSVKKHDILRIYNTETAQNLSLSPEDIAGVCSDTFFKTLCIKQLKTGVDGSNAEIAARLSNISVGGDERYSFSKALKLLENARREIKPQRGGGGCLNAVTSEISALERKAAAQENAKKILSHENALKTKTENTLRELEEEYEKASKASFSSESAKLEGRILEIEAFSKQKKVYPVLKKLIFFCAILSFAASLFLLVNDKNLWFAFLFISLFLLFFTFIIQKKAPGPKESQKLSLLYSELEEKKQALSLQQERANLLKEKIHAQKDILAAVNMRILTASAQLEDENADSLPILYEKRDSLEKQLHILNLAIEALENSYAKMQKDFTPAINKKASEYFSFLTEKKYSKLYCDENFNLSIEADMPRESGFFSGGTVDQLYLSLRLSLIDMLFKESSAFIILDQPFLQYDKKRTKKAVTLLENLPKTRQILLFTADEKDFSNNIKTEMLT